MRKLGSASLAVLLGAMLSGAAPSEQTATGVPPVMKKKGILTGQKYLEQTWPGGDLTVPVGHLTVAARYYWFGRKNLAVPTELAVRCQLAVSGEVEGNFCNLDGEAADPLRGFSVAEANAGLSAAIALGVFDGPAPFPVAKDYGGKLFVRWVRYHLRFEAFQPRKIDLTTGALLKAGQLKGLIIPPRSLDPERYPSRALRAAVGGTQTLECQIQYDYSIICRTIKFDPAENGVYFDDTVDNFLLTARAPESLDSGQNSAGTRFQLRVRWTVPVD